MGKRKIRKTTVQEELIAAYSKHSISSRSTFHPNQWGNGREPADMIIAVGRSVLFVNATAGKSYFEDLCAHNLDQARARIIEWREGLHLRGSNEFNTFAVEWKQIDHIAVISVVDGPHSACIDHPVEKTDTLNKVRLRTTLTSQVMRDLAQLGGGARDLIAFCRSIRDCGKVSEGSALALLKWRHDTLLDEAKALISREPTLLGKGIVHGKPLGWFDEFRAKFEGIRRLANHPGDIFSDLSWRDVFAAAQFITISTADIESAEGGNIRVGIPGWPNKFQVVVSSSMKLKIANLQEIIELAKANHCAFSFQVDLTHIGPIEGIYFFEPPQRWAIDIELDELAPPANTV